jgi:hypothetical protein
VGCSKENSGSHPGIQSLFPASCAQAPAISFTQAGKVKFGPGSREIVPLGSREFEKVFGDFDTNCVHPNVIGSGVALSISVETGHGILAADLERATENIPCWALDGRVRGRHGPQDTMSDGLEESGGKVKNTLPGN